MDIRENVSLSELTTFRTGGPARFLITLSSASELPDAREFAKRHELPIIPIGEGSNMLADDRGVKAVFVRLLSNAVAVEDTSDSVTLWVDAGHSWDALALRAADEGWWGIENLTAIPGTAGAAVVQNIGAYGAVIGDSIVSVDAYDLFSGEQKKFSRADIGFGYRTSVFKKELDRYFIHRVIFTLAKGATPRITYRDLAAHFAHSKEEPTLKAIRSAVAHIRAKKFPPLAEYGTAGSFFLNPVLPEAEARRIKEKFPTMPLFPLPEGGTKVPLAWILDHALFLKGKREGSAFLWPAQALVIATEQDASSDSVLALAHAVQEEVKNKTGIEISPEVRILSFEKKYARKN